MKINGFIMKSRYKLLFYIILFLVSFVGKSVLAAEQVSVFATNVTPGEAAIYEFSIVFNKVINNDSEMIIQFPKSFNTKHLVMASSDNLDGSLSVNVIDQKVYIKRGGEGKSLPAGSVVDLKIASVLNPQDMASEHQFSIALEDEEPENNLVQIQMNEKLN